MSTVRIDSPAEGVKRLTLDDPDKRNAMGEDMAAELRAAATRLGDDPEVRAVVVTGSGSAFCAGADLPGLFGDAGERPVTETHERLQRYYQSFLAVKELPVPTVAAVNGPAVGAGLNLALACDLRLAGHDAKFGATFTRIGLHPGGGCTWFLVRALGSARALRTLLLGETIDAETAVAWGLAEGPHDDPVAAATTLTERLAAVDGALARHVKRAVSLAVETDDFDAVLAFESWAQAASATSEELAEWVARFRDG